MPKQNVEPSINSGSRNQLTPEERVQIGQMVAQLMNAPVFNWVIDQMNQRYYLDWQKVDRHDTRTRERLWDRQAAVKDILQEMVGLIREAQEIVQESQNAPAERERQRLDEQGYGLNFSQEVS